MGEGVNRLRTINYDRKCMVFFAFCTCGQQQTLSMMSQWLQLCSVCSARRLRGAFRMLLIENDFLKVGFNENV